MKRFFSMLTMAFLSVLLLVSCSGITDSAETSDITAESSENHYEGSPDVGIWYCTYYFTSPYDVWDLEYGPETKVKYRPLCSNTPGDFRKYDAADPDVIDFHLQQIADAKIDFLLFELSPGSLGGYRTEGENVRWVISVNNAREVCKRIKIWNDNKQNKWKLKYAICGGCHPDVWDNQPGFPPGLCMEDTARDVYDSFFNNPEYGGADNYYHLNGLPLLVFWGYSDSISNHWANYGGDKTYGSRFSLRPASGCHYGEYGWNIAPTGTVLHSEVEVVSPGWGHYTREVPPYVYRRNGDFYKECWEKVLKYPLPQIVMITTFNDYWENTAVWTADTANLTDADKWCEKDGQLNPSMYWDMTKYYINKMRSESKNGTKRNAKGINLMIPGSGPRIPLQLSPPGAKGGAKFTVDFNVAEITVLCPNWANNDSDMIFHLYRWDTDYDTTIATEPLWTDAKTGIGYPDNGNIGFEIDDGIAPPGTYLWILEGVNSTPGFWAESNAATGDDSDVVFFYQGESVKDYIVSSVYGN
ncbi:MAG: hypothetical protein FWD31_01960 [Planctomycetaceae bacterium]|nr:hypothetical protein [Planctomycetaceae bacterium]